MINLLNFILFIFLLLCLIIINYSQEVNTIQINSFHIHWDIEKTYFEIFKLIDINETQKKKKILFRTLENWPFLTVGYATTYRSGGPILDGNYKSNEWTLFETPYQSMKSTYFDEKNSTFIISGDVWGFVTYASYELSIFIPRDNSNNQLLIHQLELNIKIKPIQGRINRLFLNYWCHAKESFYGFGTQFTHLNVKGLRVPIIVSEQGIGRGSQPTTFLLNLLGDGVGGNSLSTYAPKLLYITNFLRSIVVLNSDLMFFDARDDDSVVIEVCSNEMKLRILDGDSIPALIKEISTITGRMSPLPSWTQEGAIIGLEGGSYEVSKVIRNLMSNEFSLPIVGIWLQDWVGMRHGFDGDRLNWNWRLDELFYPKWKQMVSSLGSLGIRVLTYINPFFSNTDTKLSNLRNIFQEGIDHDYYIKIKDASGSINPQTMHSGSIDFHMVDLTNPEARQWMKDIIKYEMIAKSLSSGWMADFGEYAPYDSIYFENDTTGHKNHNEYPQLWAKVNHEAIVEAYEEGIFEQMHYYVNSNSSRRNYLPFCRTCSKSMSLENDNEFLFFMRSAWLESPRYASSFWLGDQLVTWDKYDGIKSVVVGMLSSGISGHSLTHSDIGGYTIHENGPMPFIRSKELLFRWIELSAFSASLFRTHVGLSTDPVNAQIYSDNESIYFFSKFSQIFSHLRCYRKKLMNEATTLGYPVSRTMSFHYGESFDHSNDEVDEEIWKLDLQFMFGDEFLVAPVLDSMNEDWISSYLRLFNTVETFPLKSTKTKHDPSSSFRIADMDVIYTKVYLPKNTSWIFLWTGQEIQVSNADYYRVASPIGYPPVFFQSTSIAGHDLQSFITSKKWNRQYINENQDNYMEPIVSFASLVLQQERIENINLLSLLVNHPTEWKFVSNYDQSMFDILPIS